MGLDVVDDVASPVRLAISHAPFVIRTGFRSLVREALRRKLGDLTPASGSARVTSERSNVYLPSVFAGRSCSAPFRPLPVHESRRKWVCTAGRFEVRDGLFGAALLCTMYDAQNDYCVSHLVHGVHDHEWRIGDG